MREKKRLRRLQKKINSWKKQGYTVSELEKQLINKQRSKHGNNKYYIILIVIFLMFLMIIYFSGIMSYGNDSETQDLVALWSFDEGVGTNVYDSSGNNDGGTVYGAQWTIGISGSALRFDGVDDYVLIPHDSSLAPREQITVLCWLNLESFTSGWPYHAAIIGKGGYDVGSGYELEVSYNSGGESNRKLFWRAFPDGEMTELEIDYSDYLNEWHFLVATCDDTYIRLFIDGDLISEKETSGSLLQNVHPIYIGRRDPKNLFDRFLAGSIDEVSVYNYILSESKIKNLYERYNTQNI